MAAEFPSQQTPTVRGGVVTPERIYVDLDGERVAPDSTVPKRLYAHAGATLSESEARRLGVTGGSDPAPAAPVGPAEPEGAQGESPSAVQAEPDESYVCDCGFEAKSAAGLAAHQRTHEGPDE